MELFYTETVTPPFITLDENDTRHCIQVLRYKIGDSISVTNGKGQLFKAELVTIEKRSCTAQITETITTNSPVPAIHLAVGITKQSDRWEWMVEKVTELGIQSITPIITKRTEKQKVNKERLSKVMLAALKQSAGLWLPVLHEPMRFADLLKANAHSSTALFIAHNEGTAIPAFQKFLPINQSCTVLIGPEGGFEADEVHLANKAGAQTFLLGKQRLRVETAAITAVAAIRTHEA